jgi:hypothetical protein
MLYNFISHNLHHYQYISYDFYWGYTDNAMNYTEKVL